MEVHNAHKTEVVFKADGPILQHGVQPHGSGSGTSTGIAPATSMTKFRPYPVIIPTYIPVYSAPVVVDQFPVTPPLITVTAPAARPSQDTPAQQGDANAKPADAPLAVTTIFSLTPIKGGILVLSVLGISVTIYKKWDTISKLFK